MKLSKTLPFAILSMAVVALAGCKNEFDGYKFYKLIEEVPATCTRGGMKAHYESEPNDKGDTIYLDVDKKKVDKEDLIIPATGHNMTFHKEVYSTCTEEGIVAHYHCDKCNLDYEDETGKVLIDDLHKSTKGHVMDHVWTPSPDGVHHYHKCAREGCDHIEDEELCVCDKEVVSDEFLVEGETNKYYKSCECGRKGTETFTPTITPSIDVDDPNWEEKVRAYSGLSTYDPKTDAQVTLKDLGIDAADYIQIPDSSTFSHTYGTYNIDAKGGIDLVFNMKFERRTDSYVTLVLGSNGKNEEGLQIRLKTNTPDGGDAYIEGYYFSLGGGLTKEDGKEFYNDTTADSYFVTKPGATSENLHKIEVKLVPAEIQNNADVDLYKITIIIDNFVFTKKEGEPGIDNLYVGFPKGYFDDHGFVRFSSNTVEKTSHASIKDVVFPPRFVLMDEENNCIGSKLFTESNKNNINLPHLVGDGKKFIGYYDTTGNEFTSTTEVDNRIIVYTRFIDMDEDPSHKAVTLSDLKMLSRKETTNNTIAGDYEEGFRRIPVDENTKSVQVSFVANFDFANSRGGKVVDDYFQFGLPYDYKDNQTRFVFRINADSNVHALRGYVGGPATSLGVHGTDGTYFTFDNFELNETSSYLITMSYKKGSNVGLCYSLTVTNLGTNETVTHEVDNVEFVNSNDFSFTNPYRNYFSVIRSRADAVLTMRNAW